MRNEHFLNAAQVHYAWNRDEPSRLAIEPGDIVRLETRDSADGYYSRASTHLDVARKAPLVGHPLTGPIRVRGARPGDCLAIEVLSVSPHSGFGWTAIRPGKGLLPQAEFPQPYIALWELESDGFARLRHRRDIAVPISAFPGIVGTALAERGLHSTIPPRHNGGNMDIKHLVTGSILYLPVFVDEALLSIGDAHAAQGDGEVCITAIEMAAEIRVRIELLQRHKIAEPQFRTSSQPAPKAGSGCFVTTAHGPDLYEASRQAIRYMIDHLVSERALTRAEAYVVCSVSVDLKICEIVDAPNWLVSAFLPESIFVT